MSALIAWVNLRYSQVHGHSWTHTTEIVQNIIETSGMKH